MTRGEQFIRWPVNMPLSEHDLWRGEMSLVQSFQFDKLALQLLSGARVRDLSRADGTTMWDAPNGDTPLDYLVCVGDAVLMAIQLFGKENRPVSPRANLKGLLEVHINVKEFAQGEVGKILDSINTFVRKKLKARWRCSLRHYPEQMEETLLSHMLLERQEDGILLPTEYGADFGLIRNIGSEYSLTYCSAEMAQRLPELLEKTIPCAVAQGKPVPFEKRLQAYRTGQCSNGRGSVELLKQIFHMSLDEYLDGFPQELTQLQEGLGTQIQTYGDAVQMLQSRLQAIGNQEFQQAVELMHLLATPILEDGKVVGAMRANQRKTGTLPDFLPERYCKTQGQGGERAKNLQARVSRMRSKLPVTMQLFATPQASFFQGVGTLTRSGYPKWRSEQIREFLELQSRCSYAELLRIAEYNYQQETSWNHELGVRLCYLLLIEPYCLISNQFDTN